MSSWPRRLPLPIIASVLTIVTSALGSASPISSSQNDSLRLAYVTWQNGNHALNIVNRDGTNRRVLANRSCCIATLSWAPDASKLVYENYALPGELRVVNASGSGDSTFVPLPLVSDPQWSPDGRHVAFTEFVPLVPVGIGFVGENHVLVVDKSGSNPRLIAAGEAYDPAWSPDGKRLAYENAGVIFVAPVDGAPVPTRISPLGMWAFRPSWSPDGRSIAFLGQDSRASAGAPDIYVAASDGSGSRKTAAKSWCCASWAPDSKRIAFGRSDASGNASGISIIDITTGVIQSLTSGSGWWPRWSPDGAEIAFLQDPNNSVSTLAVIRQDGSSVRSLATGPISPYFEWSRQ